MAEAAAAMVMEMAVSDTVYSKIDGFVDDPRRVDAKGEWLREQMATGASPPEGPEPTVADVQAGPRSVAPDRGESDVQGG